MKIDNVQTFILTASVSEESGIKPEWAKYSSDKLKTLSKKIIAEARRSGHPASYGHRFVSFSNTRNNVLNTVIESTEDHDGKVFITLVK